ncbi:PH domain-containing protein [Arcanobacterium pinnipediorum]|uniref:PH domain-containing protein n=1 Tax=Arcanobacterium pinnipediorum TaxID=1503041 RepID=A0ABY5AEW1_9ACTO|nr:PH domain-containing protein [Arcanobacterium pinnipediorum]USR78752.1 PH domain-containing protein [Arcanobacterium pinnipediorum]
MALSEKLLGRDEHVIRHMHEHVKTLLWNACGLVLILVAFGFALIFLPDSLRPWGTWLSIALGVAGIFVVWFLPWLRWMTSTYTITNRRIITRTGIFSKTGHDIPLARVSNVAYQHDLIDRLVGAGTLILETSAAQPLVLRDVPRVEEVHVELTELLFATDNDEMDA